MLKLLLPFQILFIPCLIILTVWAVYRTVNKKDRAVGLVLYVGLLIIVDSYLDTGIFIPGLESGSIKYSEALLPFLLLLTPKTKPGSDINKLVLFLIVAYFVLFVYSASRGTTLHSGINYFRRIFVPQIFAFFVAYKGFRNKEDYKRFFFFLTIIITIMGLFTFWDAYFDRVFLHSELLHKPIYYLNRGHGRFGSFFLNPNYMGAFFVLIFPIMFLFAFRQKKVMQRVFCWVGLMLFTFAFLKTQSRGPMLGLAVAMIVFVFLPVKQFSFFRKIGMIILILSILTIAMPGFYKFASSRFHDIETESSMDSVTRKSTWVFTIENIVADYPVFGIGLGEDKYIQYMTDYGFLGEYNATLDNPHNSYIQIAVMAGCVALLVFVIINIIMICNNILFIYKYRDDEMSFIQFGLTSGIVGFLFCLVTDMHMFTMCVAPIFWFVVGLSFSINSSNPLISHKTVDSERENGNDAKRHKLTRHKKITVL